MTPQTDWRPRLDPVLRDRMHQYGITKADLENAGWQLVITKCLENEKATWGDVAELMNLRSYFMPNEEPVDKEVNRQEDFEDDVEESPYDGDDAIYDHRKDSELEH